MYLRGFDEESLGDFLVHRHSCTDVEVVADRQPRVQNLRNITHSDGSDMTHLDVDAFRCVT